MKTPPILLSAEGRTSLVDISAEIEICKFPFCYMKRDLKYQRILILFLLSLTVLAPIFFIPEKLAKFTRSFANKEFVEDISTFTFQHDSPKLSVLEQEIGENLKEPERIVYKDGDISSVRKTFDDDQFTNKDAGSMREDESSSERSGLEIDNGHVRGFQNSTDAITRKIPVPSREKGQPSRAAGGELDVRSQHRKNNDEKLRVMKGQIVMTKQGQPNRTADGEPAVRTQNKKANDGKLREMKDQIIMAKAYLNFAPPNSNSHLVRELKLRIKEVERAVGEATKDSDLHRSALQRMRSMEATLSKVSRVYSNCSPMASKLRAMTANTEEQFRAQKNQAQYLIELAARTFPKGLHCLSMKLTTDYFSLRPEEREISNKQKLQNPDLHHYALFSDNILACTVVVNSTVSSSMEPEKIVFHVVTDALNFPAITMWFLSNPPGEATIEVKILDDFKPPSTNGPILKQSNSRDLRFISPLNYLRFYLPELFPQLNKIVLLDHDVVVQRDLRQLWGVHMKGKVNGAVETCGDSENDSSHRLDMFVNFSDPMVAKRFDAKGCTWAFGLNVFDLQEWRKRDLTRVYHKWLQLGKKRQLWKAGSLPLGQVVFYNHTMSLDRRWHVLGLGGYDSGLQRGEIEKAAVIHYDGHMKPWLEIGIAKYKGYWNKFVPFDHPFLQQCNIHQ